MILCLITNEMFNCKSRKVFLRDAVYSLAPSVGTLNSRCQLVYLIAMSVGTLNSRCQLVYLIAMSVGTLNSRCQLVHLIADVSWYT
jgi:hypothetical protein